MSALGDQAEEYLRLRQALGHQLADAVRLLPDFVAHLEAANATTVTVELALSWVRRPDADPASSIWLRRMTVVRGFARHLSGVDPATEIPPLGLVSFRARWRPPFIYSAGDIEALMTAVPRVIPSRLRAATVSTVVGLLAATGMRVGEVLGLTHDDVDWDDGVLVVRGAKFNKSREIPLDPTTVQALLAYVEVRDRLARPGRHLFVSSKGTPIFKSDLGDLFRKLLVASGVGASSPVRPRVHDLRHSFAVNTLVRWHRRGEDVGALLPRLSTYLGHLSPGYTYWYLSAAPELLALAASRLEGTDVGAP